jgi:hypothetical protein
MSQTTTEMKLEFERSLGLMRTLRDEVRLKLHLAGMDVRDEWAKLEPRLFELEQTAEAWSEATCAAASDAVKQLSKLRAQLS